MKLQKWAAAGLVACAVALCGCTAQGAPSSGAASSRQAGSGAGISRPEPAASSRPVQSAPSAALQDIRVDAEDGSAYLFTGAQQTAIAQQVADAVAKYQSGAYPLTPGENTDYAPFAQPWPEGVPYPESVSPPDILFTTEGFEMFGIGAKMELPGGTTMAIELYANQDVDKADPGYWGVGSIGFFSS